MSTIVDDPSSKYVVQIDENDQSGSQSIVVSDQEGNVVGSASLQGSGSEASATVKDASGTVIASVSYGENGNLNVSVANESGILTPVLDAPAMDPVAALSLLGQLQALFMECGNLDVTFFQGLADVYRTDVKAMGEENLKNATEAMNKQKDAAKGGAIAKAFSWVATVVAVVAAVAVTVATAGAATPAAAMLIAGATLMLASQISAETGGWMQKGMTAMCGGNEMAGMIVLMVAITALSLGGAGAGAMAAKAGAKAAEAAAKGAGASAAAAESGGATAATAARTAATATVRAWGDEAVSIAQKTVDDVLAQGGTASEAAEQAVMQAYMGTVSSRISGAVKYATYAQLGSGVLATGAKIPSDIQQFKLQQAMYDLNISQADLEKLRKFFGLVQKALADAVAGNGDAFEQLMLSMKAFNQTMTHSSVA